MINNLMNRKNKMELEKLENKKKWSPERKQHHKGQNLQNLENTKKQNEEIEDE